MDEKKNTECPYERISSRPNMEPVLTTYASQMNSVGEESQAPTVLFHFMATQRRPNYEVKTQCVLGEGWGWREVTTGSKRGPFGVMKIFIS